MLNALVEARLANTKNPASDPVLDRLFAEFFLVLGPADAALPLLERTVTSFPRETRYILLLAKAREMTADFTGAERDYRSLALDPKMSAAERRSAGIGLARVLLANKPDEAADTIAKLPSAGKDTQDVWEAELIAARAAGIAGRRDEAAARLERAWIAAADARVEEAAPGRVAADRAVIAALSGDRARFISLSAVDRSDRYANDGQQMLRANLPACGTQGIREQDFVILEFLKHPKPGDPSAGIVYASRPGIAHAFLTAALRTRGPTIGSGQVAHWGLRCTSSPSANFTVADDPAESAIVWLMSKGAYPAGFSPEFGNRPDPGTAARLLGEREARFGPDSIFLAPALLGLNTALMMGGANDSDGRRRMAEYAAKTAHVMNKAGAPVHIQIMFDLMKIVSEVFAEIKRPALAQVELSDRIALASRDPRISLDLLYALVRQVSDWPNLTTEFKSGLLQDSLSLFEAKTPADDRRRIGLVLRLIQLRQESGDTDGADELRKRAGVQPDLCILASPRPRLVSSNIVSDDYPEDLILPALVGLDLVEFRIAGDGGTTDRRVVVADPPFAFEEATLSGAATIRYEPGRVGGRPSACTGQVQVIRWQLPDQ